jgi:outer membrane lipoprotein SlyB
MYARLRDTTYEITVRLEDGAYRVVRRADGTLYRVGDRVRWVGGDELELLVN